MVFGFIIELGALLLLWEFMLSYIHFSGIDVSLFILLLVPFTIYLSKFFIALLFVNFVYFKKE